MYNICFHNKGSFTPYALWSVEAFFAKLYIQLNEIHEEVLVQKYVTSGSDLFLAFIACIHPKYWKVRTFIISAFSYIIKGQFLIQAVFLSGYFKAY